MHASLHGILVLIILSTSLASADPPVRVHEEVALDGETDLHALCEGALRECWDLDPLDLGMNPVTTALPPLPTGTLETIEGEAGLHVKAEVMGQKIHLKGSAIVEHGVAYHADEDDPPSVPCRDPAGCPDLMVDIQKLRDVHIEQASFVEGDCSVVEGSTQPGDRTLLRFTFKSPNEGDGDLVIGDPDDHPEWFQWGECHEHWHFREYADYRLWDLAGWAAWKTVRSAYPHAEPSAILDAFPELRDHYRGGHKQGFCVIDVAPTLFVKPKTYTDCENNQGISVGFSDVYGWWLSDQWVDVTGLEDGYYVLEAEVNPERLFWETNYANNDSAMLINLNV